MLLDTLVTGLYVEEIWVFCIVFFTLGLIFFATDLQLGLMLNFFTFAAIFIVAKIYDGAWEIPVIFMFIYLVLMAFSFYMAGTGKTGRVRVT